MAGPYGVQDGPSSSRARRSVWLIVCAALLGAFAILTGVELTLVGEGSIVVNVAATDGLPVGPFKLLVDGKKVACERAACTITRLSLGAHAVELAAQGFAVPAVQNPRVKALQTISIGFLLEPLPMALRVVGTQPGVRLLVDENEIGPLPQLVTGLARGHHQVRVVGDDDYEPLVRQIELEAGHLLDLGEVTLVVLRGQVRIVAGPIVPERVLLIDEAGSHELKLPATLRVDARQHGRIVASKPGYFSYEQVISFADGKREQIYTVKLERPEAGRCWPLLDIGDVQATVARYTGSLKRRCQPLLAERALNSTSKVKVTVAITILANGTVGGAKSLGDTRGYPGLAACVESHVRRWVFAAEKKREDTIVNVPFVFDAP